MSQSFPILDSAALGSDSPVEALRGMMAGYPCYAFVMNEEQTGAKALFRGRWRWEDVSAYLMAEPTMIVLDDERASGYQRFRLYSQATGFPVCLAEIEVYFARGAGRTTFWAQTDERTGALALAA